MAWTTPGTVAPGEVYTSSRYNTDTVGNLEYLKAETDGIGLVLIASEPFAAASSVAVNNCFTSIYTNYRVMFYATGSTGLTVSLRLASGGTAQASGSNYSYISFRALSNNTSGIGDVSEAANEWVFTQIDDTGFPGAAFVDLFGPATTNRTLGINNMTIAKTTTSEAQFRTMGVAHQQAAAYDGIALVLNTGNITGRVCVYGYSI